MTTQLKPPRQAGSVFEGYDCQAEKRRYRYPDVTALGVTLNRGTTRIQVAGDMNAPRLAAARKAHHEVIYTTTHDDGAPVLELGYPHAGQFVSCAAGVYMDCMLGVAQKLLDEHHPRFKSMVESLLRHQLLLRREIATDDYLVCAPGVDGIATPQDLAGALAGLATKAFPRPGGYRVFFGNSGTEAIEAGIKLACRATYRRLIERHGQECYGRLCQDLGIARNTLLDDGDRSPEPLYRDYPFFLFACQGAFHGRTLGALMLTQSKKAHQFGYFKSRWVHHVTYNGDGQELARRIDPRPLPEILAAPGGARAVIEAGRVPKDLAAAFVAEGFQGEGGYVMGDPAWFGAVARTCREQEIFLVADEVQSFGRTGTPFMFSNLGVAPDILCLAKAAAVGATIAPADLERYLQPGWHSNTWGGGKVFDVNFAHATVDALANFRDPAFDGLDYWSNERVKGQLLHARLAELQERHARELLRFWGVGCMHGLRFARRERVAARAWERGLKLLGCGRAVGEEGTVRLLFLADVTTHEIEEFVRVLDEVLTSLA